MIKDNNNQIKKLEISIKNLNRQRFFKIYSSFISIIFVSFLKGLASGLGWVLGATILVSILTFALSQIEFIPILGEWVSKLIAEIKKFDR